MISAALNNLIEQKLTTVGEISGMAGVSTSTVYRWINGQTQPPYDAIRLLIRHLSDPEAQRVLLLYTVRGTPWQVRGPHLRREGNGESAGEGNGNYSAHTIDNLAHAVRNATVTLVQKKDNLHQVPLTTEERREAIEALEDVAIESSLAQQTLASIQQAHSEPREDHRPRLPDVAAKGRLAQA